MQNNRKNRRFNCLVPVEGQEGGLFSEAKTLDLSKGGIGFISQFAVPVDEEIAIEMDLIENGEPVFVIGKVRWVKAIPGSDKFRLGITFENVLRGSATRLKKYFKSLGND